MCFKQAAPLKTKITKVGYRVYSPSAMINAYQAVLDHKLSVKRASITYGIPQTTLRQRVLGRVHPETTSSGPAPVISQEEEAIFVEHLKSMATFGYGYTVSEVVNMASNYAIFLNKCEEGNLFSMRWFNSFMKRWPELKVTRPRALANYRAKSASHGNINNYFERLDQVLTKFDLKNKPQCVYNVDEKGIQTEHSPPFVVSADPSIPAITSSRSNITTIVGCGNAIGTMMPPFYIFKGKRLRNELLNGSMAGSVSDSGWINSKLFLEYLSTHFLKFVQRGDAAQTVLLLFDGHRSHINIPTIEWAKLNNIELFVLPAHTSHILQPLDVGCFGPLQRVYNSECHKFIRTNPSSTITRYNVAELTSKAYEQALSPSNLKSSFKRSGIYPFDPAAIDITKLTPAKAFIALDEPCQSISNTETADANSFFKERSEVISKKRVQHLEKSERNTLSRITSGTSITDNETTKQIREHQEKQNPSGKRQTNQQKTSKKMKTVSKGKCASLPVAGPSGLHAMVLSESESDLDSDILDEEKCCVCHKYQPAELTDCVSVVFTKWAQCDFHMCSQWTHLIYYCKQRVVRRHDRFMCPCHAE